MDRPAKFPDPRTPTRRFGRTWLPVLLALGLFAALWLALAWQRGVHAEVDAVTVSFINYFPEGSETDCGVGKELVLQVGAMRPR